jgi:ketosteroid isomerase-like protein
MEHGKEDVRFDGGSDEERRQVLEAHRAYLRVNSAIDATGLRQIWSSHPDRVFFNGNGHTYRGIEHWLKLWDYYRPRLDVIEPFQSKDVHVTIRGDMALVTSDRTAQVRWRPTNVSSLGVLADTVGSGQVRPWHSRSTEVFVREAGQWKCVHIHLSTNAEGAPPE